MDEKDEEDEEDDYESDDDNEEVLAEFEEDLGYDGWSVEEVE